MIATAPLRGGGLDARNRPLVFLNHTRCAFCRATYKIQVRYYPGCPLVDWTTSTESACAVRSGWSSAGHASVDLNLDNAAFVAVCQHCRARHTLDAASAPKSATTTGGSRVRCAGTDSGGNRPGVARQEGKPPRRCRCFLACQCRGYTALW